MKKLELKHIAPYLPYGLIYIYEGKKYKCSSTIGLKFIGYDDNQDSWHYIDDCKPILRPLSDLTKEIEANGEKFIPRVKMGLIHDVSGNNILNYRTGDRINILSLPCYQIEYLFELHFDVFGLIEQDLAIDINTLEK